jgi:hypothetical protein
VGGDVQVSKEKKRSFSGTGLGNVLCITFMNMVMNGVSYQLIIT